MLFCYYLINILKMNESSYNEKESQEVLLTSNMANTSMELFLARLMPKNFNKRDNVETFIKECDRHF